MVLFRAHFKGSGVAKSKIGFTELLGKRFSIFVTLCKQEVLSTISQVILCMYPIVIVGYNYGISNFLSVLCVKSITVAVA